MLLRLFSNAMRQALIFVEIFWDQGRSGIAVNVGKMPKNWQTPLNTHRQSES
jgi:hypothetical protein